MKKKLLPIGVPLVLCLALLLPSVALADTPYTGWWDPWELADEWVEVEKSPASIPVPTQWWSSVAELEEWVEDNHLPIVLIAGSGGRIGLNGSPPPHDPQYDCDDYAEDLVSLAESKGYRIMECPVRDGYVWETWVIDIKGPHVGCWTKVNGVYYYVEPFPLWSRVVKIISAD